MLDIITASPMFFFFSSRRRHTRYWRDWSSDVCSSDLEAVRTPSQVVDTVQNGVADVRKTLGKVAGVAGEVVSTVARVSARPAPTSPLNASVGRARRYVMVGTDLE